VIRDQRLVERDYRKRRLDCLVIAVMGLDTKAVWHGKRAAGIIKH
jgi:hypothetical protein